jgi:hypothetical protein
MRSSPPTRGRGRPVSRWVSDRLIMDAAPVARRPGTEPLGDS